MSLIYRDDVGVKFTFQTLNNAIPITNVISVIVRKPDLTMVTWTPSSVDASGNVYYTNVTGDLNQSGEYQAQVKSVNLAGTETLLSEVDKFYVYEKLS